ncbi:unnamed protein product [Mytilus edulis]|uniref:C1q domain-containing protein n=1 Tax=Mytilus edulis TaxID=6550 RepID=A0A8S3U9A5_MYTED|nr:unnamed protein product [Mytilus edulis]
MVALTVIFFVGFLRQVNNCECAVRDEHISQILQRLDSLEQNVEHLQKENIVLKDENRKLRCSSKPVNTQKFKKLDDPAGQTMNSYLKSMTERVKFHTDKKNGTSFRDNNTEIANTIQLVEDKRVYKRLLLSNTCEYTQKSNKLPTPMTTSTKIAFLAYLSKTIVSLGSHQPIEYDQVLLNDGNGFDVRHGHFTAPTTGVYTYLVSNGNLVNTLYADGRTDNASQTNTFPMLLKEGDMVWLRASQGTEGHQL